MLTIKYEGKAVQTALGKLLQAIDRPQLMLHKIGQGRSQTRPDCHHGRGLWRDGAGCQSARQRCPGRKECIGREVLLFAKLIDGVGYLLAMEVLPGRRVLAFTSMRKKLGAWSGQEKSGE